MVLSRLAQAMPDLTFQMKIRSTGLLLGEDLSVSEVAEIFELLKDPESVEVVSPTSSVIASSEADLMSYLRAQEEPSYSVFNRDTGRSLLDGLSARQLAVWLRSRNPSYYRVEKIAVSETGERSVANPDYDISNTGLDQARFAVFDRDTSRKLADYLSSSELEELVALRGAEAYRIDRIVESASGEMSLAGSAPGDRSLVEPDLVKRRERIESAANPKVLRWVVGAAVAILGIMFFGILFEKVLFPVISKLIWYGVPTVLVVCAFFGVVKWVNKE